MNHNSLGCEQPYITHRPRCKNGSHPMYMYIHVYDCIVILTGLCDREGEGDGESQTGRGEGERGNVLLVWMSNLVSLKILHIIHDSS